MSKFVAHFEDTTIDGLLHQVWDFLNTHKGFGLASEVIGNDNGGEGQFPEESSFGNDKSEGAG